LPLITSPHNDRVKLVRSLQTSGRARRQERKLVLEGVRLVADALAAGAVPDFALVTPDLAEAAVTTALAAAGAPIFEVSPEMLAHAADTQTPQGIIAVLPLPEAAPPDHVTLLLILDAIADPGNLGTILRTAAAAGADVVALAPNSVDPFNPKVLRGAMGAHFRLPIVRWSWREIADRCRDLPVFLADAEAAQHYNAVDWRAPLALIIGGEAHGAASEAHQLATTRIAIPMANQVESLNAAIATGVLLFEIRRQRRQGQQDSKA